MEEIKREIKTEQIVYEITKEELDKIKRDARIEGRFDIFEYCCFSFRNYRYQINQAGLQRLISNIVDFMSNKTNTIENIYGYSFNDFMKYER